METDHRIHWTPCPHYPGAPTQDAYDDYRLRATETAARTGRKVAFMYRGQPVVVSPPPAMTFNEWQRRHGPSEIS